MICYSFSACFFIREVVRPNSLSPVCEPLGTAVTLPVQVINAVNAKIQEGARQEAKIQKMRRPQPEESSKVGDIRSFYILARPQRIFWLFLTFAMCVIQGLGS